MCCSEPCLLIPALVSPLVMRPFFSEASVVCERLRRFVCVCVYSMCVRLWLHPQPHFSPGTQGSGYPADLVGLYRQQTHKENTHTHTRTHKQTQSSALPGSSTAGSNEGPIGGIQRTPHNCLTEKPKLLMGTTLIFPFLKEAFFFFFPLLSLISKCLVFQTARGRR